MFPLLEYFCSVPRLSIIERASIRTLNLGPVIVSGRWVSNDDHPSLQICVCDQHVCCVETNASLFVIARTIIFYIYVGYDGVLFDFNAQSQSWIPYVHTGCRMDTHNIKARLRDTTFLVRDDNRLIFLFSGKFFFPVLYRVLMRI